jgi:hypothetical protein
MRATYYFEGVILYVFIYYDWGVSVLLRKYKLSFLSLLDYADSK